MSLHAVSFLQFSTTFPDKKVTKNLVRNKGMEAKDKSNVLIKKFLMLCNISKSCR